MQELLEEVIEELPMKKIFVAAAIWNIAIMILALITL